jgi:hypothetical protein
MSDVRERPIYHWPGCRYKYDYDGPKCPECNARDRRMNASALRAGAFDVEKARQLANELLDSCAPDDKLFMRIAMTLRAACNEVDFLRAREGRGSDE